MQMENNGAFDVLVYPHVDYAFIVTLLLILDKMEDLNSFTDLVTEMTSEVIANSIADFYNNATQSEF